MEPYDQMYYVTSYVGSGWSGITDYFHDIYKAMDEVTRVRKELESYRSWPFRKPLNYAQVSLHHMVPKRKCIDRWEMVKHGVWVHYGNRGQNWEEE